MKKYTFIKNVIISITLLFIIFVTIQLEYQGIGPENNKNVKVIAIKCGMNRGGWVCHAQVKDIEGFVFNGLTECESYNIGKKATMSIALGVLSRKERYYISCDKL